MFSNVFHIQHFLNNFYCEEVSPREQTTGVNETIHTSSQRFVFTTQNFEGERDTWTSDQSKWRSIVDDFTIKL